MVDYAKRHNEVSHIIFDISAGIHDENYPGELEETLAALHEEYRLAAALSPAGNQRDLLDLERTLFSGNWTGLAFRMEKAMRPGGCPPRPSPGRR